MAEQFLFSPDEGAGSGVPPEGAVEQYDPVAEIVDAMHSLQSSVGAHDVGVIGRRIDRALGIESVTGDMPVTTGRLTNAMFRKVFDSEAYAVSPSEVHRVERTMAQGVLELSVKARDRVPSERLPDIAVAVVSFLSATQFTDRVERRVGQFQGKASRKVAGWLREAADQAEPGFAARYASAYGAVASPRRAQRFAWRMQRRAEQSPDRYEQVI